MSTRPQLDNQQIHLLLDQVKVIPQTIDQKNIKTNTSIQLSSSINIKVTADIKTHLEDFGYITRFTGRATFFPTKDRKEDIIRYLITHARRIDSPSPMASPWRFGKFRNSKIS